MSSRRLQVALEAVFQAGRSTLAHFQVGTTVEWKADASPVTVADKQAEQIIRDILTKEFPAEAILGEEHGLSGSGTRRWIIDPIDGTKSFICGVPLYATLLSYEVKDEPVLGICYFPALDEMLYAEKGGGAWFNGRPATVSKKQTLSGSVVCCGGHRNLIRYGRSDGLEAIAMKTVATRTWSDAYGHALVATGRVEAMIDPIVSHWDVSSMALIVAEAGGRVTNFEGENPLTPVFPGGEVEFISSNGLVHEEVLDAFR